MRKRAVAAALAFVLSVGCIALPEIVLVPVAPPAPIVKPAEPVAPPEPLPSTPAPVVEPQPVVEPAEPEPWQNLNLTIQNIAARPIVGALVEQTLGGESRRTDGSGFVNFGVRGLTELRISAKGYYPKALWRSPGDWTITLDELPKPKPVVTPGLLTIEQVLDVIKRVHDAERVDLGARSTRESRNAFWLRAVQIVHYGHATLNLIADNRWCVKDGGSGRPQSDDVIVLCSTREAWDLIASAGADGYRFHADAIGVLPAVQTVYPPSRPR